jgi:small subunit ribosomal protein S27Ae
MSAQKGGATAPAPAPAPAEGAEAPAPRARKERKERKPKVNVKVWTLYKLDDGSVQRLRRECPRCGRGYFMAEHKDRQTCGHCGFTTFKNKS